MPKATPAADDAAILENSAADSAVLDSASDPAPPPDSSAPARWRYVGTDERIYPTVPVTVRPGDVLAWPVMPADDGRWGPCDAVPDRVPDNQNPDASEEG